MLIGYDKTGEIQFIFTDEKYLDNKYPNNTAKISNFWKIENHGLKELFIPIAAWVEWDDHKKYKVINKKLVRKKESEIKTLTANTIKQQGLFFKENLDIKAAPTEMITDIADNSFKNKEGK